MTTIARTLVVAVLLCIGAGLAVAGTVTETEPNNSIAGAQNIDSFFTLDFSADIGDSTTNTSTTIPHVTILGTGDGTADYYSFDVPFVGALGIFDIDYGAGAGDVTDIDAYIFLYGPGGGGAIDSNDDAVTSRGAGGSTSSLDSYIEHTFAQAGTHTIAVEAFFGLPQPGETYTLQVSIEGHDTQVPEPGLITLLALGTAGVIVGWRRQRRK